MSDKLISSELASDLTSRFRTLSLLAIKIRTGNLTAKYTSHNWCLEERKRANVYIRACIKEYNTQAADLEMAYGIKTNPYEMME